MALTMSAEPPPQADDRRSLGCSLIAMVALAAPAVATASTIVAVIVGYHYGLWYGLAVVAGAVLVVMPLLVVILGVFVLRAKNQAHQQTADNERKY